MAYYVCDDCEHYDHNDINRYDEGWCTYYCRYYPKSDRACSHFEHKPDHDPDCFLTTAMCNIFGMTDDCYILNVMRNFRDKILINNPKYHEMLAQYEFVGPLISKNLYADPHRQEVADYYFENYIYAIVMSIQNNHNTDEIVNKYLEMGYDMKRMYGITKNPTNEEFKLLTKKIQNRMYKNK